MKEMQNLILINSKEAIVWIWFDIVLILLSYTNSRKLAKKENHRILKTIDHRKKLTAFFKSTLEKYTETFKNLAQQVLLQNVIAVFI